MNADNRRWEAGRNQLLAWDLRPSAFVCGRYSFPALLVLLTFLQGASAAEPPITAAAFARDGASVVIGSQAGVEVRSWPDLKSLRKLSVKMAHVHDLAFSPDGGTLAIAGGSPAEEGVCELFSWPEGVALGRQVLHQDMITALAWSDTGDWLATASGDALVRVADRKKPAQESRTFAGHARGVLALAFLPGGKKLVSAGLDQTLRVWDVETGREERSLVNHTAPVVGLAVRPALASEKGAENPRPLVATIGRDRTLRFWQPTIGRMVRFARLPAEPVSLAWTSDGRAVAAGCDDGRVRLIDPDTLEVLEDLPALEGWVQTLVAGPDSHEFLAGGERGQLVRVRLRK